MLRRPLLTALLAVSTFLGATACGGKQVVAVRGSDVPGLDEPAMSTGLDRVDLEQLLDENMANFFASPFYLGAQRETDRPQVAIMPMENWTTEHVEPQLQAVIGMVETQLVQSGTFRMIAAELREQILAELQLQQGAEFDPTRALPLGRQLGVHYFVTGRVVDNAERTDTARRVQYFMFMQAISVATGEIVWQHEAQITKALVVQGRGRR
jgi:penicillin-binding protein activator